MPEIVVVGSGVAGLAAAVSAAEHGASVLVLERGPQNERGGGSLYTGAYLRLASEDELAPHFRQDFMWLSGGRCDLTLVDALMAEAIPTIHWVRECGVRFSPAQPTEWLRRFRTVLPTAGGGAAILDALEARARGLGVSFAYRRIAHELTVVNGRVAGVEVIDEGGRAEHYDAAAVVLACGGFQGSLELQRKYLRGPAEHLRLIAPGSRFNQGEGIEMALRIGARPAGDYELFHAETVDPRSQLPEPSLMCYSYGVLLNARGKRFIDEALALPDIWYEEVARALWLEPGSIAYMILDASYFDLPGAQRAIRSEQPPITADSLDELVDKLPVDDRGTASRTLRAYNDAAHPGRLQSVNPDDVSVVVDGVPKSNWAYKLQARPFTAYPMACANVLTFGGLAVTPEARVLGVQGAPLDGLFAAGETMGLYYGRYVGATSVLRGLVFGRIAGRVAAHR